MNCSSAGSFCHPTEVGDILISNGSHAATGCFDVVIIHPETKKLVCFPLMFLDDKDYDFTKSIHKVSSKSAPSHCIPIGKLELKWTLKMY